MMMILNRPIETNHADIVVLIIMLRVNMGSEGRWGEAKKTTEGATIR